MDKDKQIEIIFDQWSASLKSKDRSKKSYRPNFEELFQSWKDISATFDELYEIYLPKAIKAHLPDPSVIRGNFKNLKSKVRDFDKTEKEFTESWIKSIHDTATEIFFEFFPATPIDHDPEPKVFGSMSQTEYRAQRRYADQFPTLNTKELVRQWNAQQEYNPDVEDMLADVLGNKDETN